MKKNIIVILSMLLIFSMFLSMAYVALIGKDKNAAKSEESQKRESLKQDLRINISKEPSTLHPGLAADVTSGTVVLQTFEGLTRIDMWGQTVNAAAKVVKISQDQKTYTFTLRDAKWSNGDPVVAKDFEFAWKWALNPANHSESAEKLYYIEGAEEFNKGKGSADKVGIKALNDKTLQVKLEEPTPNFLQLTALPTYFPVNSKVAGKIPDWANESKDYISNGAFKLVEWSHNNNIVLKKNEHYWDSNSVKLKTITMFMVDPLTEITMFDKSKLDWAGSPAGHLPKVGTELFVDAKKIISQPITGHYIYQFNTGAVPFNNENIRMAFALSINRQKLIGIVGERGLSPAMGIVPPNLFPDKNKKGYFKDDDVEDAKKYLQKGLEELGYHNASELPPITLSVQTSDAYRNLAQAIQKMWKENLGVGVTVDHSNVGKQNGRANIFDYEVPSMEWIGYYNDPFNFLNVYLDVKQDDNGTGWENKEYKSLLKRAQTEADQDKRLKLLKQAEGVLMDEMPVIPIYNYANTWVQNKNLQGVALSGLGHLQFKWAYFEED
ncbi:peptide ABC transporter substrate-binding protein [Neobacillus sp. 114]|uniref:peptide ABC transporter substrate-binding protein n=1 Tax=Neobacillus sp. 114 TaxID=3048535 RepID=UPI0024C26D3F|nr:peptide ABC transporter substrate-binding protein [Neobacillus sp. 114]